MTLHLCERGVEDAPVRQDPRVVRRVHREREVRLGVDPSPEGLLRERTLRFRARRRTGGHTDYVRCPNITGFFGRANVFLDAVGFSCSQGTSQWPTAQFGGGGGQFFGTHPCPNGYVASGITGHAGAYVDSLALICRSASNAAFTTPGAGGNGGSGYYFECPAGQKLIGFNLHDNVYVDGIEPVCGWR